MMELGKEQQEQYERWIREFKLWEEALGQYHDRLKSYLLPGEVIEGTLINIPNSMFRKEAFTEIEELRANMKRTERRQNSAFWKFMEYKERNR
jgi:hypothetical protein